MIAMVLNEICEIEIKGAARKMFDLPFYQEPLKMIELPKPVPEPGQVLVRISACGVCHTELDEIEGRLRPTYLPLIPGHEIVGRVENLGPKVTRYNIGDRVGVAWIYSSCGTCKFCIRGYENLCGKFQATGLDADGGYAQYIVVPEDSVYPIPEAYSDSEAAPLLCAGVIGYRALRLTGIESGATLGLYGFGASAHIAIQVAKYWGCKVFVFSRKASGVHHDLALGLGADWVGTTEDIPPERFDCAIDFTPVGEPVRQALKNLEKGGRLVVNAIRKIDAIPELEYTKHIWHEKELKSVANVTKRDALEFLPLAAEIGIAPEVQEFELEEANHVLRMLKQGEIHGAAVLRIP
ncbi:zinc-dependent alcohol dehydrogenase family protein [Deltaproteobacteria bacterium]|nr:zinc-dependent alcohol dehydrogenase family protein [Deltaproteobacteria bacterium]